MMKKISLMLIAMLFLIGMFGCSSNNTGGGSNESNNTAANNSEASGEEAELEERVFKIAFSGPESHMHYRSITVFDEELRKRSDGRLSLELYPNNTLGTDAETMTQLTAGSIDMAAIISGELANHSESFNAWFMPFLFESADAAYEMSKTEEAMDLFTTLEDSEVHPLGYFLIEMRDVLSKDEIITDVKQLEGVNVRVTPSPAIVDFWATFGANATPVDFTEIYSAFQTGVINALDSGPTSVYSSKFHEVGKYYTYTNHMAFNSAVLFSEKVWNTLPDIDKQLIQESLNVAMEQNLAIYNDIANEALEMMEAEGVEFGELVRNDEFNQIVDSFIEKYVSKDEKIKAFVEKAKELAAN